MATTTTVTAPAVSRLPTNSGSSQASLFFPARIGSEAKFPYMKIQCLKTDTVSTLSVSSVAYGLLEAVKGSGAAVVQSATGQGTGSTFDQLASTALNGLANMFSKIAFSNTGTSIGLYIPELQETIDPVWGEKDMMIAGNLQEMASQISGGNYANGAGVGAGVAAILAGKAASKQIEKIGSKVGIDGSVGDAVSYQTRKVPNQKRTLLFDGMNLRSFAFSWKLIPRNTAELTTIYAIIDALKLQALPSLVTSGTLFAFPDPVKISFHNVDTAKFPTINECVIDSVKVNYTPDRALQLFESGAPVSVAVDITVKELDVLVKNGNTISSSGMYK